MGAIIEATGLSTSSSIRSSIEHAGVAAQGCLESAGVAAKDVGILINVGVYRDANMVEPAMAALIQKRAGINPDFAHGGNTTLSFDLMNGACGALNAIQVASAMLATGTARHVLIVSSDAHPANRDSSSFPFATLGGAMLLGHSPDASRGFGPVRTAASSDGSPGVASYVPWMTGANEVMSVDVDPTFVARALAFATETARAHIEAEKLDLRRTFVVSSHPSPRFAHDLAKALGVDASAFATAGEIKGDPNSSALTLGYHLANARGIDARYDAILFVAVGSGLSAACAVYRR
jgi:3-oxoacyl-[acyl-carrier-protein] synthase-3